MIRLLKFSKATPVVLIKQSDSKCLKHISPPKRIGALLNLL